jgi:hypothetical protein
MHLIATGSCVTNTTELDASMLKGSVAVHAAHAWAALLRACSPNSPAAPSAIQASRIPVPGCYPTSSPTFFLAHMPGGSTVYPQEQHTARSLVEDSTRPGGVSGRRRWHAAARRYGAQRERGRLLCIARAAARWAPLMSVQGALGARWRCTTGLVARRHRCLAPARQHAACLAAAGEAAARRAIWGRGLLGQVSILGPASRLGPAAAAGIWVAGRGAAQTPAQCLGKAKGAGGLLWGRKPCRRSSGGGRWPPEGRGGPTASIFGRAFNLAGRQGGRRGGSTWGQRRRAGR